MAAAAVLAVSGFTGAPTAAAAAAGHPKSPTLSTGKASESSGAPATAPQSSPTGKLIPIGTGSGPTAAQQRAMVSASAQAARSGKAVSVSALTSETWAVVAEPGGGYELTANPEPVRTLQDGAWVPVDTALHKNTDGTYSPVATAYGKVTFSGGGISPAATTRAGTSVYSVSWPTALPVPKVSGSSATYDNVLPGVDLQLTATVAGGFSEVFVVHSEAAARNPALKRLTFEVHSTGATDPVSGVLLDTGPGGLMLQADSAVMWDSNTVPAPPTAEKAVGSSGAAGSRSVVPSSSAALSAASSAAASDPSTAAGPGLAAHTGSIGVSISAHALTLTPDVNLLQGTATDFPLYLDPTLNWHVGSGGTPAFDEVKQGSPCNGAAYYNNSGSSADYGELGAGYLPSGYACDGIQRAYYQWKIPGPIDGAKIELASVKTTEVWQASFNCSLSRTMNLHEIGSIGSGTDWSNRPGNLTGSAAFSTSTSVGAAYNPTGCPNNTSAAGGFTVTSAVQSAVSANAAQITFALTDDAAESAQTITDFARFADNPSLSIEFDHAPTTPVASQLNAASGSSDTAACATASPYPYIGKAISTNPITLNADKITSPDADELQATFKYGVTGSSTTYTGTSADDLASGGNASLSLPSSFTSTLTNGTSVSWQVQTTNGTLTSGWSPTCTFTAEPSAPDAPTIAANSTYPAGQLGAAAGTAASFQVSGNSDGAAATEFYYRLDILPFTTGTPTNEIATASANAATLSITPTSAGPHTLYVDAVDAAGDISATASYSFIAAGHAATSCTSLSACFNNTSISANSNPAQANADGGGYSFSATDLNTAGWTSGGEVTVDGASLALPAYGSGQADNVLAAGQTVSFGYTAPANGASSLMFLATATNGDFNSVDVAGDDTAPAVPDNTGVAASYCFTGANPNAACTPEGMITYYDSASETTTEQTYFLTVPDWATGPSSLAAVVLPHRNNPTGQQNLSAKIYAFSVPLQPGMTIQSITLPDVSSQAGSATSALHVYALGTRNTTMGTVEANGITAATTGSNTWTGAWASDTEGNFDFESGNFDNQSFRVLLQPSVSGATVRIKLDNALGSSPIDIGHATVALTNGTAISPTAATSTTPVSLTFAGHQNTVIPEGGMVFSDPLTFSVTAGKWLAVSFQITNPALADLVQHSWATDSYEYVAPVNTGDHTSDTAASEYTASGSINGTFTDLVTGVDVQTAGVPTQIVLGDNLIDAWEPNTAPLSPNNGDAQRISDNLVAAEPSTPSAFGTINAGIEANQITADYPETLSGTGSVGGPSAQSRIDRDVLDEPGISTVILDEGLEDALTGAGFVNIDSGIDHLLTDLSSTETNSSGTTFINTVAIGLTPCTGYNGDGETGTGTNANDPCGSTVDATRTMVNSYIADGGAEGLGPFGSPTLYYIDPDEAIGVPASSGGTQVDAPAAVGTSRGNTLADPVNLSNAGMGALTNAILAAADTWTLSDGNSSTSAADTSLGNNSNAYLSTTDATSGTNPLTLNGGYSWTNDATHGTVLTLDGSSGYGATSGPPINTADSFSVSAWANLSSLSSTFATVAAQDSVEVSSFFLQYNASWGGWCFNFFDSDSYNVAVANGVACTSTPPSTNTWYHLVGVYNASTMTSQLYVNGALVATGTNLTTWNGTGGFVVGESEYDTYTGNYFPGEISNVQAWNYALSAPQVTALYEQIS